MSRPNPSVVTCMYCDLPPLTGWPAPALCLRHLSIPIAAQSGALLKAIEQAKAATSETELIRAASLVDYGIRAAELNFPAEIIMHVQMMPQAVNLTAIMRSAEEAMMQIAFMNLGEQPPCSFIMACHEAGWRYRIDKGFHKVTAPV